VVCVKNVVVVVVLISTSLSFIAFPFKVVQEEVAAILKDRILVGHSLKNDLAALLLKHPFRMCRDLAHFRPLQRRSGKPTALRYLTNEHLGVVIQDGEHSSTVDAKATMLLFQKFKRQWEQWLLERSAPYKYAAMKMKAIEAKTAKTAPLGEVTTKKVKTTSTQQQSAKMKNNQALFDEFA
jgi:hypothetical protein